MLKFETANVNWMLSQITKIYTIILAMSQNTQSDNDSRPFNSG